MINYDKPKQLHELDNVSFSITENSLLPCQSDITDRLGNIRIVDVIRNISLDDIRDGVFYQKFTVDEKNYWNTHAASKNNPHTVTKEQIDLGFVDNTSDLDKPLSTAVIGALALKADKITVDNLISDVEQYAIAAAASAGSASTSETNAATSEINAAESANNASISASNASISETNAAASESAAALSETNAATSATNAATSETNAASYAAAANASKTAAATSATNAAASALAAATSEDNAATSETNAASSASSAATSATNAAGSATNANNSRIAAATSETNAANSASAANASKLAAAASESAAASSATNAATSATQAASSSSSAASSASAAALSETNAAASASSANSSKLAAETAETNAAASSASAATSATNAANSATAANTSKLAAAASASAAATSETNAAGSATAAATSATNAATSETNAAGSATAAATSATNAANSASAAATSATNAAGSATAANNSKLAAAASESAAALSETNAANSASAASLSETNAAGSATAAATSATNAATSETNAAGSASSAASSASAANTSKLAAEAAETNAAASASAANLSRIAAETAETNAIGASQAAALSETNAANSASAASLSETNAATSETNAAGSAAAASLSETNASTSEYNADQARILAEAAAANLPNAVTAGPSKIPVTNATGDGWNYPTYNEVAQDIVSLIPLQGKNYIINGNFRFWQRGTAQSSIVNSYGSDDRWINEFNGITRSHGLGTFPLGQTEVEGNPTYYSSTNVQSLGTLSSHYCIKRHRVDRVQYSSGKTMTLSFWARTSVPGNNLSVSYQQSTGVGGSVVNNEHITKVTLSGSWTKFTATFTWLSIAGETLGSNHYFGIDFWFSSGSNFNDRTDSLGFQTGTFEIAQVQLEDGTVATDFENIGEDLQFYQCLRYYQKTTPYGTSPYYPSGGIYIRNCWPSALASYLKYNFFVPMRVVPTVTFWNTATETSGSWRTTSSTNLVVNYTHLTEKSILLYPTLETGSLLYGQLEMDAEL